MIFYYIACAFSSSQENLIGLVKQSKKKIHNLTKEQLIVKMQTDKALDKKVSAGFLFKDKKFKEAAEEFEEAANTLLNINKDLRSLLESTNYQNLVIECLNNLAVCKIKLKEFNEVLIISNKVR
jgi:type VI protein secretion system component VasF